MNLSNEVKEVTISVITKLMNEFDSTELWLEEITHELTADKIVKAVRGKYPIEELKASLAPYLNDKGYIFDRYQIEIISKAIGVVNLDYFLDDVIIDLIECNINLPDLLRVCRCYSYGTNIKMVIEQISNSWCNVIPS